MRFISLFLFCFISFSSINFASASVDRCNFDASTPLSALLRGCADWTQWAVDPNIGGGGITGVKDMVVKVAKTVLQFGALFAVGAIVWSGIQYNIAYGDDERIKKAKNTAIYAGIGLFLLLVAFPLIDVVISFIYSVWGA